MEFRDQGVVPATRSSIHAIRTDDDPVAAIEKIYRAFDMDFDEATAERIRTIWRSSPSTSTASIAMSRWMPRRSPRTGPGSGATRSATMFR